MVTPNISQNSSLTDPTDLSAVSNTAAVTNAGYGGPHAVFDKDHYKAQMRLQTKMVEFNAAQGTIANHGYIWSIILISYHDTLVTEMMGLPSTELVVNNFFREQMEIFIEKYKPKRMYFPALDREIAIEDYDGVI